MTKQQPNHDFHGAHVFSASLKATQELDFIWLTVHQLLVHELRRQLLGPGFL